MMMRVQHLSRFGLREPGFPEALDDVRIHIRGSGQIKQPVAAQLALAVDFFEAASPAV